MGSRFIALPVGQGDAFYLQRGDLHILVDGGRGVRALPGLLKTHVDPPRLDVVVCTHNDADHANGLIGLFEELPVPIREVWLPGTWAWRFEDLMTAPEEFFHELVIGISEIQEEVGTLEECYEPHQEKLPKDTSEPARVPDAGTDVSEWFQDILDRQGIGFLVEYFWHPLWKCCIPVYKQVHKNWPLWIECLDAAHRIKSIAEAAANAGVRIRLFEFTQDIQKVGGGSSDLEPVNSREVFPQKRKISALDYLALTKANRESLVFYAAEHPSDKAPAVLFSADSDLAFGLKHVPGPSTNIIVTSPHHGSEANAAAYQAVSSWINRPSHTLWVRSDCKSKSRPGATFKSQQKRVCTLCNSPTTKAAVRLHASRFHWQRTPGTRWCSCR